MSQYENKPSCFGKKLDCEACYNNCPVSDECYEIENNKESDDD